MFKAAPTPTPPWTAIPKIQSSMSVRRSRASFWDLDNMVQQTPIGLTNSNALFSRLVSLTYAFFMPDLKADK